jgi:predicted transcriptional regulator
MMFLKPETVKRNLSPERNYLARTEIVAPELEVIEKPSIGRGHNVAIPDYIKATVAALANEEGVKQTDVAEAFGLADSSVSNFANGMNNSREPDEKLKDISTKAKADRVSIEDEALKKTMMALNLLGEQDVMMLGAKDKSIVAGNLSKVAANMRDKNIIANDNRIQMVINSPQVREHYHYPELEVG